MSTAIVEQLKAQLAKLAQDRREHEKAVNQIKAMEAKTRKALASVSALTPSAPISRQS